MRTVTEAAAAALIAMPSLRGWREARTGRSGWLRPAYLGLAVLLVGLAIVAWFWMSRPSSSDVVAAWGLPGVWQQDCAAPARLDNPRYKYGIEGGRILLTRDFGRGLRDTGVISGVEAPSRAEIRYVVHFTQLGGDRKMKAHRQNVLTKSAEGRIRAVSNNTVGTGEATVVDGIRVDDRQATPWMTRCAAE